MALLTVLGSVFLPREAMEPFASALTELGHDVAVSVPHHTASAASVAQGYATATPKGPVLVAHSNAGNFVPALVRRRSAAGAVFMDAVLPPFDARRWPVVPKDLAAHLRAIATDDALPPWTRWWPLEEMIPLFPSAESFRRIDAIAPEVPLSYLDAAATADRQWSIDLPGACLALSSAYARDVDRARDAGWPTATLDVGHMGMLKHPMAVARRVSAMVDEIAR